MATAMTARDVRRRKLGIDCVDSLEWKRWEVGTESIRKIRIKNVDVGTQVIEYSLAKQKTTFEVPFPQPVSISSGMSYDLEVRFRPTAFVEYHDEILITVRGRGTFPIELHTLLPYVRLAAPEKVDFNYCAVARTVTRPFKFTNEGTVPLRFRWDVVSPFAITPERGELLAGESLAATISFTPSEACPLVTQAVCYSMDCEDEVLTVTRISAIGKYAYVCAPDGVTSIDFGEVIAGTSVVRDITLENRSAVPAEVVLRRLSGVAYGATRVTPRSFTLAPDETQKVAFTFAPSTAGSTYSSEYMVYVKGGNTLRLCTRGVAQAPKLTLSTSVLNFGDVDLDTLAAEESSGARALALTKVIVLTNHSPTATDFQVWGSEPGAAFAVSPSRGQVTSRGTARLRVTFTPTHAINYLRRLYLIATNAQDVLLVDVFGSAYNSFQRPLPFSVKEVDAHFLRLECGLAMVTPDELADAVGRASYPGTSRFKPTVTDTASLRGRIQHAHHDANNVSDRPRPRSVDFSSVFTTLAHDGVGDVQSLGPFALDKKFLHFRTSAEKDTAEGNAPSSSSLVLPRRAGGLADGRAVADGHSAHKGSTLATLLPVARSDVPQQVSVRNESDVVAVAYWNTPVSGVWMVYPEYQDVPPRGSATFFVSYKPATPAAQQSGSSNGANSNAASLAARRSSLHTTAQTSSVSDYLECYVNYKQMVSFRTAPEHGFTPPHCLLLQCCVDAASAVIPQEALPRVGCPKCVIFPPCMVNGSVFVVVPLTNDSDVSVTFSVQIEGFVSADDEARGEMFVGGSESRDDISALKNGAVDDDTGGDWIINPSAEITDGSRSGREVADHVAKRLMRSRSSVLSPPDRAAGAPTASGNAATMEDYIALPGLFHCYPERGIIAPRSATLVLVRFTPPGASSFRGIMSVGLGASHTPSAAVVVALLGEGHVPRLRAEVHRTLFFRPTCVGGASARQLVIRNECGIPVRCIPRCSEGLEATVQCTPEEALLQGYAEKTWTVTFTPKAVRTYAGQLSFHVDTQGVVTKGGVGYLGPISASQLQSLRPESAKLPMGDVTMSIHGECQMGTVDVEPSLLDFGSIVAGRTSTRTFTIFNSGACDLYYEVRWLSIGGGSSPEPGATATSTGAPWAVPKLARGSGRLLARTSCTVHVTLEAQSDECSYILFVVVAGAPSGLLVPSPVEVEAVKRHPHTVARIASRRPMVQIVDVRSATVRRSTLWRQLSVPSINAAITVSTSLSDSAVEKQDFEELVAGLDAIECEIGSGGVVGAAPVRVTLRFANSGSSEAAFRIRLPIDHDVPQEPWFEEDPALDTIQHIVEDSIITISPRGGMVPVNGIIDLHVSYAFKEVGVHRLPVMLQLAGGEKILLVFTGFTVSPDTAVLALHPSHAFEFLPVAVGDLEPPMQSLELENLSSREVEYAVDGESLEKLTADNYAFPILQCVNPVGVVPPKSTVRLVWYFRPLEAKEYELPIVVHVGGGEDLRYHLRGRGFHPAHATPGDRQEMIRHFFLSIPRAPAMPNPSVPLSLSEDVLSLGALPFHSLRRSTCTLFNRHRTAAFLFEWDTQTSAFADHVVDITPARGRVEPGASMRFRVLVYAGSASNVIEAPVFCHVISAALLDEAALHGAATGHRAVGAAARAAEGAAVDGGAGDRADSDDVLEVCDHPQLTAMAGELRRKNRPKRPQRVPVAERSDKPGTAVGGPKAASRRNDETKPWAADGSDHDDDDDAAAAAGVRPFALELLLQGLVMPVEPYALTFGQAALKACAFPASHAFRAAGRAGIPPDAGHVAGAPPHAATAGEAVLLRDILQEVVKAAVNSDRVQAVLRDPADEAVPYFAELTTRPQGRPAAAPRAATRPPPSEGSAGLPAPAPVAAAVAGEHTAATVYSVAECLLEAILFEATQPAELQKAIAHPPCVR